MRAGHSDCGWCKRGVKQLDPITPRLHARSARGRTSGALSCPSWPRTETAAARVHQSIRNEYAIGIMEAVRKTCAREEKALTEQSPCLTCRRLLSINRAVRHVVRASCMSGGSHEANRKDPDRHAVRPRRGRARHGGRVARRLVSGQAVAEQLHQAVVHADVRKYLKPILGDLPLAELRPVHIQRV